MNEPVWFTTHLSKGDIGSDRMNSGRSCEEVGGRNGARDTIQQVAMYMVVSEKRSGERILYNFPMMLVSVQVEEYFVEKEKIKKQGR